MKGYVGGFRDALGQITYVTHTGRPSFTPAFFSDKDVATEMAIELTEAYPLHATTFVEEYELE